ncbi:MAG: dTMP kinase [Christensenellaceae bacterium]|jgi:dTMP kinase
MKKGLFITFEGVDGCGKSTQMRFLAEHLQNKGYECVLTREPGGCKIAEEIRAILLDPENKGMNSKAEVLLFAAARIQHIDEVILPALREGKIVLCDRYLDSNFAYQGYGRELGEAYVLQANEYALTHAMPDATLFFAYPPENAFARMNEAKEMDRLEQENAAFFKRVYEGFVKVAEENKERIISIDPSGNKFETQEKVQYEIMKLFQRKGF